MRHGEPFKHVRGGDNYHYTKGPRRVSGVRQGLSRSDKNANIPAPKVAAYPNLAHVQKSIFQRARAFLARTIRAGRGS